MVAGKGCKKVALWDGQRAREMDEQRDRKLDMR